MYEAITITNAQFCTVCPRVDKPDAEQKHYAMFVRLRKHGMMPADYTSSEEKECEMIGRMRRWSL